MDTSVRIQPLLVNQKKAAEMLGISVSAFVRLSTQEHLLMPCLIPGTTAKRYLVSDLEEYARQLKYPSKNSEQSREMWTDESGEMWSSNKD